MEREKLEIGVFFGAILAIIVVSGCIGGEDKPSPDTGKPSGDQPPEEEEPTDEKEGQPPEEEEAEKPGMSLADIFSLGKPTGYTASYDITGEGMDGVSKMTMYFAGEEVRMDTTTKDAEGVMVESSVFIIEGGMYVCIKSEGKWNCLKTSSAGTGDWEDISKEFEKDMETPLYDGTQNIAGFAAECYRLESEGTKYRYCVHPQKYLMLLTELYDGTYLNYRMIATNIDLDTPPDSSFDLPAEAMDLEEMMNDPCAACNMLSGEDKAECLENCQGY